MPKREKLSITIDPEIKKSVIDYAKNHNISVSQVLERSTKIILNKDEEVLSKEVRNTIYSAIKTFEDRYCRILAKLAKAELSNQWLLVNMLGYMANSENDEKFIKDKLNESEHKASIVLRNGIIERDIESLFPKEDLNRIFNKR